MRLFIHFVAALLILQVSDLTGQAWEGVVSMRVSTSPEKIAWLTIKDDKSVMEMQLDSVQTIKLIKDRGAATTTVLRTNHDWKYGYRSRILYGDEKHVLTVNPNTSMVQLSVTDEERYIGAYRCVLVKIKSPKATAEAWVTTETGMQLSSCFPHFLGDGTDADLYALREVADQEGLIMSYHEILEGDTTETYIEVTAEEREIMMSAFAIDPGFVVLDEAGVKRLYAEAQSDPMKKVQWEQFRQIFGNK